MSFLENLRGYGGLLLALTIGTLAIKLILEKAKSPLNKVPGPSYAKWTNLRLKWANISGRRIHYVHSLHEKYGQYVRLSPTEISVADPQSFQQIHRISSGFNKSQWYLDLVPFPRPTVFTMTSPKDHAIRRKMLARAFSKTYLRQHWEAIVHEKIQLTVSKMKKEAANGTADALKWWTLMATDTSTHLMFGDSFRMIEQGQTTKYIRVLQKALQGSGIGLELPFLRSVGRLIPFEAFQELFCSTPYLLEYGKKAVAGSKQQDSGKNIFANILQEAEKGEHLDEVDVSLEATGLIVAGSDTTAISLTYLVWAVLSQPALQTALQEEVNDLPDGFVDQDLEFLPLLNAVIAETLRLYGAAPGGLPRTAPPEGVTLGGYYCPPDTTVTTQAYTLHRNPKVFVDPFKFDHSRWLNAEKNTTSMSDAELYKIGYNPFGAGSRVCLGIHLARMELRLGAAEFFRQCKDARLAPSTTLESMDMENYFLVVPKSHRCEIVMG